MLTIKDIKVQSHMTMEEDIRITELSGGMWALNLGWICKDKEHREMLHRSRLLLKILASSDKLIKIKLTLFCQNSSFLSTSGFSSIFTSYSSFFAASWLGGFTCSLGYPNFSIPGGNLRSKSAFFWI